VEVELSYNFEQEAANIEITIILAKHGYKVRLLIPSDLSRVRTPDAFLVDENIRVEFKQNNKPTHSAIENELRYARTQSAHIVLHVASKLRKGDLINALQSRVQRTRVIETIWLIWKEKLHRFKRKEILNKEFRNKIE
jgi:hypothetical protein